MESSVTRPDRPLRVEVPVVRLVARILVGLYAIWFAVALVAAADGWYLPIDIDSGEARLIMMVFVLATFAIIAAVGWKAIQLAIGRGVATTSVWTLSWLVFFALPLMRLIFAIV